MSRSLPFLFDLRPFIGRLPFGSVRAMPRSMILGSVKTSCLGAHLLGPAITCMKVSSVCTLTSILQRPRVYANPLPLEA